MTRGHAYCRGPLKRVLDVLVAAGVLLFLAPLLLVIAVVVLVGSGPPVLFIQERIGMDGRPFRLIKFRTMRRDGARGLPITGRGDRRVTAAGRFLRASKLDELPQLLNVLAGDMSLVGPRPEVPRYVARYTDEQRRVLDVRPGLTDPASVEFRNEEDLLGAVAEEVREQFYVESVLPAKLRMNLAYIDRAGVGCDLKLLLGTFGALFRPTRT